MANTKKTAKQVVKDIKEKSEKTIGMVTDAVADAKVAVTEKIESQPAVAEKVKGTKESVAKVVNETKTTARRAVGAAKKIPATRIKGIYVQYQNMEVSQDEIMDRILAAYIAEGGKKSGINQLEVYIKPEDNAAYYVINDEVSGSVSLY